MYCAVQTSLDKIHGADIAPKRRSHMKPMSQIPDILYHYCPSSAFPEILRSGVLWLTHESGLNDQREHVWPVPYIREEMQRQTTPDSVGFFGDVAKQFDLMMGDRTRNLFIGSFSSDGDVLSQWRAYADDGNGFAIGFSQKAFSAKMQIPMTSFVDDHTIGLFPIQYDDSALKLVIKKIFESHLSATPIPNAAVINCVSELRNLALCFKNPAFREEKEWRVTYAPMIMSSPERGDVRIIGALTSMQFRSTRYGVVPYFEMPFGQTESRENAILEVVVGPRNQSQMVEMHLDSLGYHKAVVRRSSSSYR